MRKEIIFIVTVGLFLLAYALDYFAGSINLHITSPLIFLDQKYLTLYPMTFVAVISRAIALMLSVFLVLSLMDKKYFTKIIVAVFLAFVAEIYVFQSMATGARFSTTSWLLSFAFGGALIIVPIIIYFIAAIANFLIPQDKKVVNGPEQNNTSVLNP